MDAQRDYKTLVASTHTSRIVGCLQRVAEGEDASDVADDLLILMTGKTDAPKLMSERQARRLANVLRHHSAGFTSMASAVGNAFADAIEAEGMRLALE